MDRLKAIAILITILSSLAIGISSWALTEIVELGKSAERIGQAAISIKEAQENMAALIIRESDRNNEQDRKLTELETTIKLTRERLENP